MQRLGYDSEDEPFDRFLRGEPDDYEWLSDWLRFVREVTLADATVQRVRIVSLPHADYTRWGFVVARHSIAAGEDIRYLPRHLANDIAVPAEDYWLFDDETLVWSVSWANRLCTRTSAAPRPWPNSYAACSTS